MKESMSFRIKNIRSMTALDVIECFEEKVEKQIAPDVRIFNELPSNKGPWFIQTLNYNTFLELISQRWELNDPTKRGNKQSVFTIGIHCVSKSSDPLFIVSYYIKWVTTFWTHSTQLLQFFQTITGVYIMQVNHINPPPSTRKINFAPTRREFIFGGFLLLFALSFSLSLPPGWWTGVLFKKKIFWMSLHSIIDSKSFGFVRQLHKKLALNWLFDGWNLQRTACLNEITSKWSRRRWTYQLNEKESDISWKTNESKGKFIRKMYSRYWVSKKFWPILYGN